MQRHFLWFIVDALKVPRINGNWKHSSDMEDHISPLTNIPTRYYQKAQRALMLWSPQDLKNMFQGRQHAEKES